MKNFEVWIEGYSATGESDTARYHGTYEAETFQEACIKMMSEKNWNMSYYNSDRNSYWACRFFDNEIDARKIFG